MTCLHHLALTVMGTLIGKEYCTCKERIKKEKPIEPFELECNFDPKKINYYKKKVNYRKGCRYYLSTQDYEKCMKYIKKKEVINKNGKKRK